MTCSTYSRRDGHRRSRRGTRASIFRYFQRDANYGASKRRPRRAVELRPVQHRRRRRRQRCPRLDQGRRPMPDSAVPILGGLEAQSSDFDGRLEARRRRAGRVAEVETPTDGSTLRRTRRGLAALGQGRRQHDRPLGEQDLRRRRAPTPPSPRIRVVRRPRHPAQREVQLEPRKSDTGARARPGARRGASVTRTATITGTRTRRLIRPRLRDRHRPQPGVRGRRNRVRLPRQFDVAAGRRRP